MTQQGDAAANRPVHGSRRSQGLQWLALTAALAAAATALLPSRALAGSQRALPSNTARRVDKVASLQLQALAEWERLPPTLGPAVRASLASRIQAAGTVLELTALVHQMRGVAASAAPERLAPASCALPTRRVVTPSGDFRRTLPHDVCWHALVGSQIGATVYTRGVWMDSPDSE